MRSGFPEEDYSQFVLSTATVDAEVNDIQTGGDDIVYIQGSLSGAIMSPTELAVLLFLYESTYELWVDGVPLNCTVTGVPGTVPYAIPGKVITESLPAGSSRLTGSITGPLEENPGITQTITWDLQADF